jgi:hypothetical protein
MPIVEEIITIDDRLLQDFWDHYWESITKAIRIGLSIEDEKKYTLLLRILHARFYKIK